MNVYVPASAKKSEILISKFEIISNEQNIQLFWSLKSLEHSYFDFVSDLEISASIFPSTSEVAR
jgi:hypothetical protein